MSEHMEWVRQRTRKSLQGPERRPHHCISGLNFSAILTAQEAERPSFILFREASLLVARDYINLLLPALPLLEPDLEAGSVAVFRKSRLRVRRIPFSG